MSTDNDDDGDDCGDEMADVSRSPQWHTVRPWSPRFLLTVREITSVSTTFILSSTCARDGVDARLASLASGLNSDDEDGLEDSIEATRLGMSKLSMVSDALGRGLSVNVNGAPWKRVLMRMDEKPDGNGDEEAILVIYGLMPGRQYDVEIGVSFSDREEVLHSRMVTQARTGQSSGEDTADISMESTASSLSAVSNASSPSGLTPMNTQRPAITLEEYAAQLRAQLAHLNQERDSLAAQLKLARKDAHKADAGKRNEIEALKRAAEKHAQAEVRGRQKMRALQEAGKQAAAAAREADESAGELEASLPALKEREDQLATRHASVTAEAARAQSEAEETFAANRARTEALRNELNGLKTRLEKLQAKKARLSGETLPRIEKQLEGLVREVELVVRDAGTFEVVDNGPVGFDLTRSLPVQQYVHGRSALINLQGTSKVSPSGPIMNDGSALVPPFDPSLATGTRPAPAFQLQASGSIVTSSRRGQQSPAPAHSHVQSHSLDNMTSGSFSSPYVSTVAPGTGSGAGVDPRVGSGPTRQSSLPLRMPSPNTR